MSRAKGKAVASLFSALFWMRKPSLAKRVRNSTGMGPGAPESKPGLSWDIRRPWRSFCDPPAPSPPWLFSGSDVKKAATEVTPGRRARTKEDCSCGGACPPLLGLSNQTNFRIGITSRLQGCCFLGCAWGWFLGVTSLQVLEADTLGRCCTGV